MDGNRTHEPDDILQTVSETPECFAEKGCLQIDIKLFELRPLSSGQAVRLAGMGRVASIHLHYFTF